MKVSDEQNTLENPTIEGDSPVSEEPDDLSTT